jgi:hypothetical protein
MTRRLAGRLWRGDDRGASLVIALIFVTVVSVVVTVALSFADTSIRTTVALRGQATAAASADGAAQIAINTLRRGSYTGTGNCFDSGPALTLSNVYQPPSGPADSAAVTCENDAGHGGDGGLPINSSNKPGSAILTLGTSSSENGIFVKVSGGGQLKVKGGIFSNSNINVTLGSLAAQLAGVKARTACTGTITSTPPPACNIGNVADPKGNDPLYVPTGAPATPRTVPSCPGDGKVVEFQPGLYDDGDINALNGLTRSSGCKNAIFWFHPGTYYFDFPSNKPWLIDTGYLVGGLPQPGRPFVDGEPPTIPGACQAPIPPADGSPWIKPPPDAGVQFVFGGTSQFQIKAAQFELCGTYQSDKPPIALFGLKTAVSGVPAQSGCAVTVGGCPTVQSDNSPNSRFFVQGTTYVPGGSLDIALNNNTGQVFRYGVIARSLALNPTGSANLSQPVIEVPDDAPGGGKRTVLYLSVYVCQGAGTCSSGTGRLRLRAKVAINDPTGATVPGAREVTVLSWSVAR